MPERIEWLDDGTAGGSPYSPRFGDRYRSELGGLAQAREVFIKGCGLPQAWAQLPQWTILETGFGLGLNFLATWAAWKADPLRSKILNFVSTEAFPASAGDVLRSAQSHPDLLPFAEQLCEQLWGLLPGFHRLIFEGGQLLLTLCIGDTKAMLREQSFEADSVYLDGFSPQRNPDIWDIHTLKAVARCCRRGTRVATWTIARSVRDGLAECGFVVNKVPGVPPKRDNLQGEFNPSWEPKKSRPAPQRRPAGRCAVIGAGLAGAAVAASLARRGWQVTVLDAAQAPASGASGLPAGMLAPHVSPDDSLLSRLSRCGIRMTLQQASTLLQTGQDWQLSGVLEHCVEHSRKPPASWMQRSEWIESAADWSHPATADQLAETGLPPDTPALWHNKAGWIKPARLVETWLHAPGVTWRGDTEIKRLTKEGNEWQMFDSAGQLVVSAELVVIASGYASRALADSADVAGADQPSPLALQPIRGQVSWALHTPGLAQVLPQVPVNGYGSLIPAFPMGAEGKTAWIAGSSFERDRDQADIRAEDHRHNFSRLQPLLPKAAAQLESEFNRGSVAAWAGVRCATPTRLPALGPVSPETEAGLWVCSGMGSRGLTFAALCAELLAARLHAEPLPLEHRLADALLPQRQTRSSERDSGSADRSAAG